MAAQAQEKTCAERLGLGQALEQAGLPAKQSDKKCYYQEPGGPTLLIVLLNLYYYDEFNLHQNLPRLTQLQPGYFEYCALLAMLGRDGHIGGGSSFIGSVRAGRVRPSSVAITAAPSAAAASPSRNGQGGRCSSAVPGPAAVCRHSTALHSRVLHQ